MRIALTLAAAIVACGPAIETDAGDSSSESSGDASTSAGDSGSGNESGESTGDAIVCGSDSEAPGGTLLWSDERPRDDRGEFMAQAAVSAGGSVAVASSLARGNGPDELDVGIDVYAWDSGERRWSDEYGGLGGFDDVVTDVEIDGAGFVHVVVREIVSVVLFEGWRAYDSRAVLLRYAPDGTKVWRFEAPTEVADLPDERLVAGWVGFDPQGGIRVFVMDTSLARDTRYELLRLDRAGNVTAKVPLALASHDRFVDDAVFDSNGWLHVKSQATDSGSAITRIDGDGNIDWTISVDAANWGPQRLRLGADGQIYACSVEYALDGQIYSVVELDPDGKERRRIDGASVGEELDDIAIHCSGDLVLAGVGARSEDDEGWTQTFAKRRNPDGDVAWSQEVPLGLTDSRSGFQRVVSSPGGDVLVVKRLADEQGSRLWVGRYAGGS